MRWQRDTSLSAGLLSRGQLLEQRLGLLERQAGIRDALAVDRGPAGDVVPTAGDEGALEHRAKYPAGAGRHLPADRRGDERLLLVILVAVAVRAVHHHALPQPLGGQAGADLADVLGVVVRAGAGGAAQDDGTGGGAEGPGR